MSLPPPQLYSVPEQTRRVARAAFPEGKLCLRVYDELGTLFEDQDFADLFPAQGQPAGHRQGEVPEPVRKGRGVVHRDGAAQGDPAGA